MAGRLNYRSRVNRLCNIRAFERGLQLIVQLRVRSCTIFKRLSLDDAQLRQHAVSVIG